MDTKPVTVHANICLSESKTSIYVIFFLSVLILSQLWDKPEKNIIYSFGY